MDINQPKLNASLKEEVKTDDSFKQDGTTIHLEGGSSYIQNSGNEKRMKSSGALFKVLFVSILCDFLLGWFLYTSTDNALNKIDAQVESHKAETDKMLQQTHEGNIWLIRYDIHRTMDLYEAREQITSKEYKRLHDEYLYYTNTLKGNHGVQERWDEFTSRLLSGELKMVK